MSQEIFSLRPYQREAIAAILAARKRCVRRQLLCLPTGAGKTVIFSELARLAKNPVLVLAHRQELVQQAVDKLSRALGAGAAIGVEQADQRAAKASRAVVASIRSLNDERLAALLTWLAPGLVIYDECHHAPAEDNRRVLANLGALDPEWPGTLLGVTATPMRADGLPLGDLFEEIVYHKDLRSMVAEGWLVPLRGFQVQTGVELKPGVEGNRPPEEESAPEFQDLDLAARNDLVARSIQELARDRRTIVFCQSVAHARSLARVLNEIGHPTGLIHGQLDPAERKGVLSRFREGKTLALTNVGVLTEGFDDPGVDAVAMARPTRSAALYAQCIGRGLRTAPNKRDCLVLDFADTSELPLVTLPSLFGMPFGLDLQGEEVLAAEERYFQLFEEVPGFEIDPEEAITLEEIQARARAFDPLNQRIGDDVMAISPFAWMSLGRRGLALNLMGPGDRRLSFRIHPERNAGRPSFQVYKDSEAVARFSTVLEAVEAVDFEVRKRGAKFTAAAQPRANWRLAQIPAPLAAALARYPLRREPANHGEALDLLTYLEFGPARRVRPSPRLRPGKP